MPTPPPVPNVIKFRITGTLPNEAAWGVGLYTGYSGGTPSPADVLSFCEQLGVIWNGNFADFQSDTVITNSVDGIDLSSDDGAGNTAVVDYPGANSDAAVSNQIAALVKYDIARRYRGGKPKMFFPGVSVNFVADAAHFTTELVNDLGTAFGNFAGQVAEIAESGIALVGIVNVSRYQGFTAVENVITGRYRNVPKYRLDPLVDSVGGFTVDPLMATQKRRRLA